MAKKINFIKLVVLDSEGNAKEDKNGNFLTETHFTPSFIPFRKIYEATDIMEGISEDGSELTEKEMFKRMTDFVVDVYNNQFTSDDLLDRLHAPDAIEEIKSQVGFIAQGQMDEQRKKQLAKMI